MGTTQDLFALLLVELSHLGQVQFNIKIFWSDEAKIFEGYTKTSSMQSKRNSSRLPPWLKLKLKLFIY